MEWRLIYEDWNGYCRIVVPNDKYRQAKESEEEAVARLYYQGICGTVLFLACKEEKLPRDTTFRDAWKQGDVNEPIKIDFSKAMEIHRGRIKEAAKKKIEQLSQDLEVAIQKSNLPLQIAIRKTCEILLTIHEMNMTHCKTLHDIKYCIPRELHDVWHFYPPLHFQIPVL